MPTKDVQLRLVISAINRAGADLSRVGEQLRSVSNRAKDLGNSSVQAGTQGARGVKKLANALDALKPKFEAVRRASDQMVSAGMQIGQVGASLLASAVFPIIKAKNFEKAMAGVRAVTAGTEEDFVALSAKAKELGATTAFTAEQAAEGMNFLGMAGFDAKEALDAITPSLLLAAAGGIELADAADISTNILKGLGMETKDLADVVDILAYTANNSNQTVLQLGEAFSYSAPFIRDAGMSIQLASSMLAQFADAGVRSTRGGTALRGVILGLAKITPQAAKVFDRLHVQVSKNADGTIDYMKTLQDLNEAGATTEDWADIFTRSFGGLASLLSKNAEETRKFTKELDNVNGVAKKTSDVRMKNLWGATKLLTSALSGLATAAGSPLLEPLTKLTLGLAKVVSGMAKWAEENSGVAGTITAVAGAIGGLLTLVAAILIPLGLVGKLLGTVGAGLVSIVAGFGKLRKVMSSAGMTASLLGRAFGYLGAAMAAWDIYRAVEGFVGWRKAAGEAEGALKQLKDQGDLLVSKFKEFKDTPLPETIDWAGKTSGQLKAMNEELIKAHLYWRGIKSQLEERAKERTFWVFETEGAKEAKAQLVEVNKKLEQFAAIRKQLFEAQRKDGGDLTVGVGVELDPKELELLQAEVDGLSERIQSSVETTFAAIDTSPLVTKLLDAQLQLERDTEMSEERRSARSQEIENDLADARISIIEGALNKARAAWDDYGNAQRTIATAACNAEEMTQEEYAARVVQISKDVTEKKKQAFERATAYLERELAKSLDAEKRLAAAIKGIQEDIAGFHESTEEKIRDLRRRGMTEEQAYYDRVAELNEKLAKARALDPSQYEEAKKLFEEVKNAAGSLVGEVKRGNTVIVSNQQTLNTAIGMLRQAEDGMASAAAAAQLAVKERLEAQQQESAGILASLGRVREELRWLQQDFAKLSDMQLSVDFNSVNEGLDELQSKIRTLKETEVRVEVTGAVEVAELDDAIDNLEDKKVEAKADVFGKAEADRLRDSIEALHDKTVTVTTRYVTEGVPPAAMSEGGAVQALATTEESIPITKTPTKPIFLSNFEAKAKDGILTTFQNIRAPTIAKIPISKLRKPEPAICPKNTPPKAAKKPSAVYKTESPRTNDRVRRIPCFLSFALLEITPIANGIIG